MRHTVPTLGESEYRFACLVWAREPIASGELVKLAARELGWKKSTSYTVLKNLIAKGVLENRDSTVTALIKQQQIQQAESSAVVDRTFEGSLPRFVAAFLGERRLTAQEAAQLQEMIRQYQEEHKNDESV